jgi:hypothetical protein
MVLKRIGVVSAGKFMGCMYGLLGLLIGGCVSLFSLIGATAFQQGPARDQPGVGLALLGMGVAAIVVLPLLYGILGFLGGIIGAAIFNLVAYLVGGLEIELATNDGKSVRARPATHVIDPYAPKSEPGPGMFS